MTFSYQFQGLLPDGSNDDVWWGEGPTAHSAIAMSFEGKTDRIHRFYADVRWKYENETQGGAYLALATSITRNRSMGLLYRRLEQGG
jgi:hypothetical protein